MNKGFFDIPTEDYTRPPKVAPILGCDFCGLDKQVKSPKIPVFGKGRMGIYLLGEAPGGEEDAQNRPFVGQSGTLLWTDIDVLGYNLDRDFWRDNALGCRPTSKTGANRPPEPKELQCCESRWRQNVKDHRPIFIILMGEKIIKTFFSDRNHPITEDLSVGRFRRTCIPDVKTKAWVFPLYHPSWVVRNPDTHVVFFRDLEWAMAQISKLSGRPEFPDWTQQVEIVLDFSLLMNKLDDLIRPSPSPVSLDYETSGVRPYREGHKIWTISACRMGENAFSFPFSYPGVWTPQQFEKIKEKWTNFLLSKVKKVGQYLQFEDKWGRWILKTETQGWYWDTMNTSHFLDERPKSTGLDYQVFINWGYEYGDDITPYKKAVNGEFNRMHEAPLRPLLMYNGLDSLFTSKLQARQFDRIFNVEDSTVKRKAACNFWQEGTKVFCDLENEGINIDVPYYQEQSKKLENRSVFLIKNIWRSEENQLFKQTYGRDIEFSKTEDLKKLFFTVLKIAPTKHTEKGNISTDIDALESLNNPIAKDILKVRHLAKLKSSYADGFLKLQYQSKLYPNYNLHIPRSFRSSSDGPSFHILPRKDKAAMEIIRGGIIPPPEFKIGETDFGAMEVRIIACVSQDPVLMDLLVDGSGDPHSEWMDFLDLRHWKEKKEARFDAKNAFVFALFYGSYYKNIHADLLGRGYEGLQESKVQKAEKEFWNKYKVVKKYQERQFELYRQNGYVEMITGFRRHGWLTRNEIANTCIQGPAFHCLLWSLIQINKTRRIENWISKIPGQIHDSLFLYIWPEEEEHVFQTCKKVMTEDIRKAWRWITVPLLVEFQVAEVGQPWTAKEEIDVE